MMHAFLQKDAQLVQDLPERASKTHLRALYYDMLTLQCFDKKVINLQRTGKIGTFPPSQGQEAVFIGMGHAMQTKDVFCPYYRDHGALMVRGVRLQNILAYWGGNEQGSVFDQNKQDMPLCVPIATQLLHATGIAYAMKYRKQKRAVVSSCGDGATSKGDFYEAINLAGVWNLPVVFVVNNNQWAISVPRAAQTATKTIAQKATAAGFEGIQIDGNDVIAVDHAIHTALKKARAGRGPTLIEAVTYRLGDHTTADDASRYRSTEELTAAWQNEPIKRLRHYLNAIGAWSATEEQTAIRDVKATIEQAIDDYLNAPPPQPVAMFDHLYETLPDALNMQRQMLQDA